MRDADLPMPPGSSGTAVMHAVHNEELRILMTGLGDTAFDRLPQELDDPGRRRAALRAGSTRADELAQAAERIGAVVGETGLTADQQRVFLALATRLRDRALRLSAEADQGRIRRISETMKEIDDTCMSCHLLFRAPGPAARRP